MKTHSSFFFRPLLLSFAVSLFVASVVLQAATIVELQTATFKIDTYTGFANLRKESGLPETSSRKEQLQKLFAQAGVTPPLTNILVTNEGMLVVRGTKEQLDLVNKVVMALNGISSNDNLTMPAPNPMARTNLIYTNKSRKAIATKLDTIRLDSVHFDNQPLSLVISNLYRRVKALDSTRQGVNLILETEVTSLVVTIPAMTDVRLADVLDAIVKNSENPIKYSIEDYAVVFSSRPGEEGLQLFTCYFKTDPTSFMFNLGGVFSLTRDSMVEKLKDLFSAFGVDLSPPKSLSFADNGRILLVRATKEELESVEAVVLALNEGPPLVNIKTRSVELTDSQAQPLMNEFLAGYKDRIANLTTNQVFTTVLDTEHAKDFLKRCEQISGVLVHNFPEVTTRSGRQAQIISIVAGGISGSVANDGTVISDGTSQVWHARLPPPVFIDIKADVRPDEYSIHSSLTPVSYLMNRASGPQTNTPAQIMIRPRQSISPKDIWDGQTIVLAAIEDELASERTIQSNSTTEPSSETKKYLLVFINPSLIDPDGNRIHTDEDVLAARKRLGVQPK